MIIELEGTVERVTYRNDENGYTVFKLRVKETSEPLNVVGCIMHLKSGETLRLKGQWENHPRFGPQVKVISYEYAPPENARAVERYLGSGLFKGIGPSIAKKLVEKFGEETLDIIENSPERLSEVEGIGEKKKKAISGAWGAKKEMRALMLFLEGHEIGLTHASKIFRKYGNASVRVLSENPYRLATDIAGIGFLSADRMAERLGVPRDSPLRAEAGILYVLEKLSEEGHVFSPYEPLIEKCRLSLGIEREPAVKAIAKLMLEKKIVIEDINGDELIENNKAVFLPWLYASETGIAKRIKEILSHPPREGKNNIKAESLGLPDGTSGIELSERQKEAVMASLSEKILIITGGPGVGKTTVVRAVIGIHGRLNLRALLAAPTGRAAKRMSELTGEDAKTIHRLLEWSPSEGRFRRDDKNPLSADLVVIDETSMVDVPLMYGLLRAVPDHATLVLVGDSDQLPSVGPGNVLRDLMGSGLLRTVRLKEIFRQSSESMIVTNAHKINRGEIPVLSSGAESRGFLFIETDEPPDALSKITGLCRDVLPSEFGLDPINDIQVITPMHKGLTGASNLNRELQSALNPKGEALEKDGRAFRVGDKVIQRKNDYDKEVFNGDIGRISAFDRAGRELSVDFEGRMVIYGFDELEEISQAYAVTVHKAQGSEYPAVVMPILNEHYILLQRNLLYTAITRAKRLVVIAGSKKALAMAVRNDKQQKRHTLLRQRLLPVPGGA